MSYNFCMKEILFKIGKIVGTLFLVFIFSAFIRILFKASNVEAESLVFHPQFCLGGWEKPQNASGENSLGDSAAESDFNLSNSAYLSSGVASQIFCGYFPIEAKDRLPKEVSISFNWVAKSKVSEIPSTVIIIPKAEDLPQVKIEEQMGEKDIKQEIKQEVNQEVQQEIKEDVVEEVKVQTPPVQPEIPTETSTPSTVESNLQSFLNLFAKEVFAQDAQFGQEFMDVSYSVDGIRWISVGKVGVNNLKNYKVTIPVSSWEELDKIQIMLNVIPTIEEKPDVYLDGMSLVVDYDRPFAEAANDTIEDTASAVVSTLDAVGEKIVSIVTIMDVPKEPEVIKPKEPIIVKEKKLIFETFGTTQNSNTNLPWYSDEFRDKVKSEGPFSNSPMIEKKEDGKSLKISGSCSEKYFVVLLWKEADDYKNRPGSFISNFADICVSGTFSYDLKSISKDTKEGDYFLLIAEEDESNPWVPRSALIPIRIGSVIEEKIITE